MAPGGRTALASHRLLIDPHEMSTFPDVPLRFLTLLEVPESD
ncbi:protein of unknown function [Pararobbsia alpina]